MANYYTNDIIFSSDDITALQDLHNHIMFAVDISARFSFKPCWIQTKWTKYYTVSMTYGVQTVYEIGRCTINDVSNINYNWFSIKSDTAWTPMIVFWVDIINKFYSGRINIQWRSWYEDNSVVTNQDDEETHYCMNMHSSGEDKVLRLDRLFDTSNAPFYKIPDESYKRGLYVFEHVFGGGADMEFEDQAIDCTEQQCIEHLRKLSSKYDNMQSLFQLITDPEYTFDGDIDITQNNYKTTEDIIEEDLNITEAYYCEDPESLEGYDFDDDRLYKVYDDPILFEFQPRQKPIINTTMYGGLAPVGFTVYGQNQVNELPESDYKEGSLI